MKLSKRGFMLAEVVVVSVIISAVLVTLFTSLSRISSAYDTRNRYYDVSSLYVLEEVNNVLINTGNINDYIKENKSAVIDFSSNNLDNIKEIYKIYFTPYDSEIVETISDINGSSNTLKDFVSYLKDHHDYEEDYTYMLISERCQSSDDCYYYGLRVR